MEPMESVEAFTRRKRGCRYVIYYREWDNSGGYGYMGNGGDTLEEAQKAAGALGRPGMELAIFDGDREHPDARDVS